MENQTCRGCLVVYLDASNIPADMVETYVAYARVRFIKSDEKAGESRFARLPSDIALIFVPIRGEGRIDYLSFEGSSKDAMAKLRSEILASLNAPGGDAKMPVEGGLE